MPDLDAAYRASIAVQTRTEALKASFGGDRSAAGRYAAEQRWKGHVKRDNLSRPSGSFGSVLGLKTAKQRYGASPEEIVRFFKDEHGFSLDVQDFEKDSPTEQAVYGVVQAMDNLLGGGFEFPPNIRSVTILAYETSFDGAVEILNDGTAEMNISSSSVATTAARLFNGELAKGYSVTADFASRDNPPLNILTQRLGYAIMIHEFAHALDVNPSRKEAKTGRYFLSDSLDHDGSVSLNDLERIAQKLKTTAISGYGATNRQEFVAEAFAAWILGNKQAEKLVRPWLDLLPTNILKASFGGDRSAAGRYAAEQRWKGHVKRETRTDANRSTDEQLAQGPQNLAFGRDKNGLPIVGSRKELEAKYGKTDKERAAYFRKKYGIKVNFVDLEGLDEDKYPYAIETKLGAVQALDDMLSNLNVIPVGLTSKPPLAEIRIGTDNPMRNSLVSQSATAFVQHSSKDSRGFLLGLDTGDISNLAQHLLSKTTPITEQQALMDDDESPLDVINLRRLEEQSSQTIAGRFGISDASRDKGGTSEKITREDEATVARRLGYAIMVHEFGHVLDTLSFFDSEKRTKVKDMTSDRLEEDDSPAWRETEAVSEYGRYNTWEKMAEGFTAWFLFSQSAKQVRYYSDLTNVGFSEASRWLKNQEVIDIKGALVPIVRPLLDSLRPPQTTEQVLKQVSDFVTTVADLPFDHPVIVFALQPFMNNGLAKAKVRVDAMVAAALAKASFGGDRSAAGRYAAEQRWKGHVKEQPAVVIRDAELLDKIGRGQERDDAPTPEMKQIAAEVVKRVNLASLLVLPLFSTYSKRVPQAFDKMMNDPAIASAKNLKELREAAQAFVEKNTNDPNVETYKDISDTFNFTNRMLDASRREWFPPEEYTAQNAAETMVWMVTERWNYDNKGSDQANFLRRAVMDEFGMSISGKPETPLPNKERIDAFYDGSQNLQTTMRTIARAMYDNTQEQLKKLSPATHVVLYRGTATPNDPSSPQTGVIPLRGLTSWSGEREVGEGWSRKDEEGSVLLEAAIPFAQIFGTPRTGFGRPHNELRASYIPLSEYLVLGPSVEATVEIRGPERTAAEPTTKSRVRVDAMIAAALAKASFGGDRSAAGRYAAEQRWKNHVKGDVRSENKGTSRFASAKKSIAAQGGKITILSGSAIGKNSKMLQGKVSSADKKERKRRKSLGLSVSQHYKNAVEMMEEAISTAEYYSSGNQKDASTKLIVVQVKNRVVGVMSMMETKTGYLGLLAAGSIGKGGVGSAMFAKAVASAAKKGFGLELDAAADAYPFWEKMGFRPVKTREGYTLMEMSADEVQELAKDL